MLDFRKRAGFAAIYQYYCLDLKSVGNVTIPSVVMVTGLDFGDEADEIERGLYRDEVASFSQSAVTISQADAVAKCLSKAYERAERQVRRSMIVGMSTSMHVWVDPASRRLVSLSESRRIDLKPASTLITADAPASIPPDPRVVKR